MRIDEEQAKRLVVQRYRELLGDKYLTPPTSGMYRQFPKLSEAQLSSYVASDDNCIVFLDPPAGFFLHARVDRGGNWVEILRAGIALE